MGARSLIFGWTPPSLGRTELTTVVRVYRLLNVWASVVVPNLWFVECLTASGPPVRVFTYA